MRILPPIEKGKFYHLYSRGINGENIFRNESNYPFFLKKWDKYVTPVIDTYAYCLLRNHFHFLVFVKEEAVEAVNEDTGEMYVLNPSRQISHCLNGYVQSINKAHHRTGSLLESPIKRIEVDNIHYFDKLITYIHKNPQKHDFVKDYRDYPHSSYFTMLSEKATKLKRDEALKIFGSKEFLIAYHETCNNFNEIRGYIEGAE